MGNKSLADNGFITEMKDKNGDSWYHQIVLEMQKEEIKRLKEEYVMLQNASDKVEEEKDREIERLNNIINKIRNAFNDKTILNNMMLVRRIKEIIGSDKE